MYRARPQRTGYSKDTGHVSGGATKDSVGLYGKRMDNNRLKKYVKELKARARLEEKLARLEAMREKAEANKLPERKQRPARRRK
jgi:hypothetical protein